MANVILKDKSGTDISYEPVEKVELNTPDGGTQIYSKGEAVEKQVELDFRDYIVVDNPTSMTELLDSPDNMLKCIKYIGTDGAYVENQYYQITPDWSSSTAQTTSGTTFNSSVECNVGDLIIAAFMLRSSLVSISDGWTLISTSKSTSEINTSCTTYQTLSFAYKYASNTTESIAVTQTATGRIWLNMIAISNAVGFTDEGYQYQSGKELSTFISATFDRPNKRFVLWGVTRVYGNDVNTESWTVSNNSAIIQHTLNRPMALVVDTSTDEKVMFSTPLISNVDDAIICGALSINISKGILTPIEDIDIPYRNEQIITADENTLINKIIVAKPDTLTPTNIPQDINIAGIIGRGEKLMFGFGYNGATFTYSYSETKTVTASVKIPTTAKIVMVIRETGFQYGSGQTQNSIPQVSSVVKSSSYTTSVNASNITVSDSYTATKSGRNYGGLSIALIVIYTI